MDLKDKIEDLVKKVKSDDDFADKFKKDPIKAVESVLGINLPDDQIEKIIDGIKAKVTLDKADDLLGSIKKMF